MLAAALTPYKPLSREQSETVAQMWQLVHTSRGGLTTKSTEHPENGNALLLKPKVHQVTDNARRTVQGEIPCADAIAKLTLAFELVIICTHLAVDLLELAARMVEMKFFLSQGVLRSLDRRHPRKALVTVFQHLTHVVVSFSLFCSVLSPALRTITAH